MNKKYLYIGAVVLVVIIIAAAAYSYKEYFSVSSPKTISRKDVKSTSTLETLNQEAVVNTSATTSETVKDYKPNTCLNFTTDIKFGDSDSKEFKGIATLQKYLQDKGYYGKDLTISGNYGSSTAEAIQSLRLDMEKRYGNTKYFNSDEYGQNINSHKHTGSFFDFTDRWMLRLNTGCDMDLSLTKVFDTMKENLATAPKDLVAKTEVVRPYYIAYEGTPNPESQGGATNLYVYDTVYVSAAKRYGYIIEEDFKCLSASCFGEDKYLTFDGIKFVKLDGCSISTHDSLEPYSFSDGEISCTKYNGIKTTIYTIDSKLNIKTTEKVNK